MLPVCSAVAAAHGAGITHRDLKPQNIFLATGTRRVHPKVLDFGISKGTDVIGSMSTGTLTATGSMIGTPYYLAPEQILDSKSAGSQSDQYALGVIFYECLTGKRPYDGDNLFVVFQGIVGGTPTPPRTLRPDIPPELEEIVLRAMKSDAKARFATIDDFGRAMLPFASSRARVIWEEAFAVGGSDTSVPPGRPSIAVMPTPSPPTRAATLMPPGLAKLPIPGATPTPPPTTSAAGLKTPTPPPRTIAQWGMSPVPASRPGTDAVARHAVAGHEPGRRAVGVCRARGRAAGAELEVAPGLPGRAGRHRPAAQVDEGRAHRRRRRRRGRHRRDVVPARRLRFGVDRAGSGGRACRCRVRCRTGGAARARRSSGACARTRRARRESSRGRQGAPARGTARRSRGEGAGRRGRGVVVARLVQEQEPLARQVRRERPRRQARRQTCGAGGEARAGCGEGRAGDRLI